jgi:hypothetical protein
LDWLLQPPKTPHSLINPTKGGSSPKLDEILARWIGQYVPIHGRILHVTSEFRGMNGRLVIPKDWCTVVYSVGNHHKSIPEWNDREFVGSEAALAQIPGRFDAVLSGNDLVDLLPVLSTVLNPGGLILGTSQGNWLELRAELERQDWKALNRQRLENDQTAFVFRKVNRSSDSNQRPSQP